MKNRILAISNHGGFLGGGEYSFLELLSNLRGTWEIMSVVPETAELASRLREREIDTITLPLAPLRLRSAPKAVLCLIGYIRLCCKYRPALVYANGSRAAFYGGIAGRLLRLPVLWHCRMADRDPLLDAILSILTSCIIVNSNATAARFKRAIRHKIRTVYNGLDLQRLRDPSIEKPESVRDDWKMILVIARVSRWKRHDLALHAFERIAELEPKAHLVCLGAKDHLDPEWWDDLQMLTFQSRFSGRIHWMGQVEDIRPWLRSAFLLLLPSLNEPFGRVLVEAMACGVPVIATRSGGVPEIVREQIDGILVTPGSANEVCEAVIQLLRDESLRNRLSESGRKRAEEFSLERHVNQMVQVFEETLKYQARRFAR
jgi:glycosyltransferase involved in cell wall biosynthesis